MSEDEKALTDAYYWLSMYKSGAITEGVAMEKVKEAIFAQPQLNENQQIVLDWLKNIYNSPIMINPIAVVFSLHNELVNDSEIDAVEAYEELGFDEEIQVLQVFSKWAQEQEEE
ncbi:hypothetical protein [Enterococcus gallinarum]|uniref:hypothetical protein n=1 Tax=Enterococcus gallinarum TaxID=1353 RepID=UPI001E3C076C|nr:hypothetical protein [Enterococcus gallinarum]